MTSESMFNILLNSLEESLKEGAQLAWSILKSAFIEHWLLFIILIFLLFFVAVTKALFGQWGALGSFLYNFFYFGTVLIVILIWGPEIIVSDIFGAMATVILYPICYYITGLILRKLGFNIRRGNYKRF